MIALEYPPALGELKTEENTVLSRSSFETFEVMGVRIAATSISNAIKVLTTWLDARDAPRLVTFTNVHMLTEGQRNSQFRELLSTTDMNCPDGMPLVWLGKHYGKSISRVSGPDFMPAFCASTASRRYRHFFYGGRPGVAQQVTVSLKRANPDLQIAGWYTPSFGVMGRDEDERAVRLINESQADLVWVCLGCPKQEKWMSEHRNRLNASLLLAVGMAFDVVAGKKARAPRFLRAIGMEWLFRVIAEPRRLLGRYLYSNSAFVFSIAREVLSRKKGQHGTWRQYLPGHIGASKN